MGSKVTSISVLGVEERGMFATMATGSQGQSGTDGTDRLEDWGHYRMGDCKE